MLPMKTLEAVAVAIPSKSQRCMEDQKEIEAMLSAHTRASFFKDLLTDRHDLKIPLQLMRR